MSLVFDSIRDLKIKYCEYCYIFYNQPHTFSLSLRLNEDHVKILSN